LKLFVHYALLQLRKRQPELFLEGDYVPLTVEGDLAEHVVAFARRVRQSPEQSVVMVVPRLIHQLRGPERRSFAGRELWGETQIVIGDSLPSEIVNHFTAATSTIREGRLRVGEALEHFPVAALTAATIAWQ
jgi:(1->4)-alpha-D-glucan 1-alpha-D-glucosylmutase